MITRDEVMDVIEVLDIKPMHNHLIVLVPMPKDTTDSGIYKGQEAMADEKPDQFMHVLAKAADVEGINVLDKVYIQGTVTTFSGDAIPAEFEVAPKGYVMGLVPAMYVKMIR